MVANYEKKEDLHESMFILQMNFDYKEWWEVKFFL